MPVTGSADLEAEGVSSGGCGGGVDLFPGGHGEGERMYAGIFLFLFNVPERFILSTIISSARFSMSIPAL